MSVSIATTGLHANGTKMSIARGTAYCTAGIKPAKHRSTMGTAGTVIGNSIQDHVFAKVLASGGHDIHGCLRYTWESDNEFVVPFVIAVFVNAFGGVVIC